MLSQFCIRILFRVGAYSFAYVGGDASKAVANERFRIMYRQSLTEPSGYQFRALTITQLWP